MLSWQWQNDSSMYSPLHMPAQELHVGVECILYFTQIVSSHKTSLILDCTVWNAPKLCSFIFFFAWKKYNPTVTNDTSVSLPACVAATASDCEEATDTVTHVPLSAGGNHRSFPVDVWNKGGALLMGTMHQLIVSFCELVSHSSSALVVIFL